MQAALPYAQAILDINEIHARQIAALKPGELPSARGNTPEEARTQLTVKLKEFLAAKYKETDAEAEAFAKATDHGANKKKVRELATAIRKRLEATPATTVPFPDAPAPGSSLVVTPTPMPPVSPATTATPVPSPSLHREL
jgi:phosphoglycolate phosphatase-like HAD superfamily hydrolase